MVNVCVYNTHARTPPSVQQLVKTANNTEELYRLPFLFFHTLISFFRGTR